MQLLFAGDDRDGAVQVIEHAEVRYLHFGTHAHQSAHDLRRPRALVLDPVEAADPATIEQGKKVFATNCVACHTENGRGNIGANLTDDYQIHYIELTEGGTPLFALYRRNLAGDQPAGWSPSSYPDLVRLAGGQNLYLHETRQRQSPQSGCE